MKQHLELSRDIAQKFNHDFGVEFFPLIEPLIQGEATRVMSLRDGSNKMSKSDPSEASRIGMADSADEIAKKIRRARTDPEPLPETTDGFEGRPEAANLVGIFAALDDKSSADVLAEYGGKGFADFKSALADLAIARLGPIGDEMRRLTDDPSHIDAILASGAERARAIAEPILDEVHRIVGLLKT